MSLQSLIEAARKAAKNPRVTLKRCSYGTVDDTGCVGCIVTAIAYDTNERVDTFDGSHVSGIIARYKVAQAFNLDAMDVNAFIYGWDDRKSESGSVPLCLFESETDFYKAGQELAKELLTEDI